MDMQFLDQASFSALTQDCSPLTKEGLDALNDCNAQFVSEIREDVAKNEIAEHFCNAIRNEMGENNLSVAWKKYKEVHHIE